MFDGQVKKYSARSYFLECPALYGNRTSTNLGALVRRITDKSPHPALRSQIKPPPKKKIV